MKLADLDIWKGSSTEAWVREATDRWAELVLRAARLQWAMLAAAPLPRTETEALVVLFFQDGDGLEPAVLAKSLHLTRPSVTAILDKLERGGYAVREPHPTDRRRKIVRLADAGIGVIRDLVRRHLLRDAAICATFSRQRVTDALSLLAQLCDKIEAWNASSRPLPEALP